MNDMQLLWVYNSQMAKDTVVKNHTHDYFHLVDIIEGPINFVLGDEEHILKKGDMILVHKGVNHSFRNENDETVSFNEIKFTVLSQPINKMLSITEGKVIHDEFASSLVTLIANEYRLNCNLKDDAAQSALKTLVMHLTAEARRETQAEAGVIDTSGFSKLSKRVIEYLTFHYPENLSLGDISEGVGITKNYLCNAFKNNTGITIIECLNMIRIRKAAEQIVYSDLPLSQVAQMCGYVSVSHFNRVFMRYMGLPPGQCRRAYSFDLVNRTERVDGSFMYSVLAGKSITLSAINEYEQRKAMRFQNKD